MRIIFLALFLVGCGAESQTLDAGDASPTLGTLCMANGGGFVVDGGCEIDAACTIHYADADTAGICK